MAGFSYPQMGMPQQQIPRTGITTLPAMNGMMARPAPAGTNPLAPATQPNQSPLSPVTPMAPPSPAGGMPGTAQQMPRMQAFSMAGPAQTGARAAADANALRGAGTVAADGTQLGGGAPPRPTPAPTVAPPQNQNQDLLSILNGLGGGGPAADGTQIGAGLPPRPTGTVQQQGAPPVNQVAPQGTSAPATPLSPQIQQLLGGVPLPAFQPADLGALGGQAEARAAQTEARMNRNTRNSFANSGVQGRGPAMAGEMNLNAARSRGGLEDTLANLGIEQANQYNANAPRFGSLMVDLLNSGNARQGQSLSFLAQMLSGLGSFV